MKTVTENLYRQPLEKPPFYAFVSLLFLACGCAHTHYVPHDSQSYNKVNDIAIGKRIEITSLNGVSWQGQYIQVQGDSISWTNLKTDQIYKIHTREIERISVFRSFTLKGLAVGFLVGFTTGATWAAIADKDNYERCKDSGDSCIPTSLVAIVAGSVFSVPGMLLGAAVGSVAAIPDHYVFIE